MKANKLPLLLLAFTLIAPTFSQKVSAQNTNNDIAQTERSLQEATNEKIRLENKLAGIDEIFAKINPLQTGWDGIDNGTNHAVSMSKDELTGILKAFGILGEGAAGVFLIKKEIKKLKRTKKTAGIVVLLAAAWATLKYSDDLAELVFSGRELNVTLEERESIISELEELEVEILSHTKTLERLNNRKN